MYFINRIMLFVSSLSVILLLVFQNAYTENDIKSSEDYLKSRISQDNGRYNSFIIALDLMKERGASCIVETGTARYGDRNFSGDGGSTIIFGDWAHQNHADFFTVDIDQGAIGNAKNASIQYNENIRFVCSDSIQYLRNFDRPIDFLYLDSFDLDVDNPTPSQKHHLREIEVAFDKLHDRSIVMIDDCGFSHRGKGGMVIDFLTEKGWEIFYNGAQVILVKK